LHKNTSFLLAKATSKRNNKCIKSQSIEKEKKGWGRQLRTEMCSPCRVGPLTATISGQSNRHRITTRPHKKKGDKNERNGRKKQKEGKDSE